MRNRRYIGGRSAMPLLIRRSQATGVSRIRLRRRGRNEWPGRRDAESGRKDLAARGGLAASPSSAISGIAHTRWATHGAPNECNAHPHMDCKDHIAVVHNGIIENSTSLSAQLEELGHKFVSDTDTEVIAHLIEEAFDGNLEDAVIEALWQVEGLRDRSRIERRPGQDRRRAQGQSAAYRPWRRRVLHRQRRFRDSGTHARSRLSR